MNRFTLVSFFVASVMSFATTVPASAADVSVPTGVEWSGFYAGVNAGAAMSSGDLTSATEYTDTGYFDGSSVTSIDKAGKADYDETSFTGGGQIGYNFQHDNLVIGVEGDLNYLGLNTSDSASAVYPCCAPDSFTVKQDLSVDWLATARGKLGVAVNQVLLYGTGGLAFGNVDHHGHFSDTFEPYSFDSGSCSGVRTGWTAGAGIEWMMVENASLKLEYLYYDLGSVSAGSTVPGYDNKFHNEADVSGSIIRAGFNWYIN